MKMCNESVQSTNRPNALPTITVISIYGITFANHKLNTNQSLNKAELKHKLSGEK